MTTWDELTIEQQTLLLTIPSSGVHISFDSVLLRSVEQLGLVECIRSNETPRSLGVGVSITPAGRALLPAPTLTPSVLDAAIYGTPEYWQQMSSASIEAHAETLERLKALEEELAQLRQFKQDQTRVVTAPSADAHGYSEETVLLSDMLSAENAKLEAENARLTARIVELEKALVDLAGIATGDWTEGHHDNPD